VERRWVNSSERPCALQRRSCREGADLAAFLICAEETEPRDWGCFGRAIFCGRVWPPRIWSRPQGRPRQTTATRRVRGHPNIHPDQRWSVLMDQFGPPQPTDVGIARHSDQPQSCGAQAFCSLRSARETRAWQKRHHSKIGTLTAVPAPRSSGIFSSFTHQDSPLSHTQRMIS